MIVVAVCFFKSIFLFLLKMVNFYCFIGFFLLNINFRIICGYSFARLAIKVGGAAFNKIESQS